MDVRVVTADGVREHDARDLPGLLESADGFVWVDVVAWDADAEALLVDRLHCHPLVVEACRQRNHVPTVHGYENHFFVTLFSPLLGAAGHVHLLELDQIVGRGYLVTVHGPINPAVDPDEALVETRSVLRRIESGRFRPRTPAEVSYAIGSAIARRQRALIGAVAEKLPALEQQVMAGDFRQPEALLEELFLIRHELITARTMAAQSYDVYARISSLDRFVADDDRPFAKDLSDQFERVRSVADGEAQFLFGVIDLYQTRVTTKMTVAMERLAVIAAVTLPVTALASIYGMNVIVNDSTHWLQLL
ncbi:MAG: magnesium transporter CorA family protein, partial [Actinomycetes bacterium]